MDTTQLVQAWQQSEQRGKPLARHKTSPFVYMLKTILGISLLFFALAEFLSFLINISTIVSITNQMLFHMTFLSLEEISSVIQYFSEKFLQCIIGIVFFVAGIRFIRNKPRAKRYMFIGFVLMILQLSITVVTEAFTSKHETESNEAFIKRAQQADRATVTDLFIIKHLNDPTLCKNGKTYNFRRSCINGFANVTFTPDYCLDLPSDYDKYTCVGDLAARQKNIGTCYNIPNDWQKSFCILRVAEQVRDETLCDKVSTQSGLRTTCVVNIGIARRDSSYCERADNVSDKDNCYYNIATLTQNRSFCTPITNQADRGLCLSHISP